MFCKNCGCKLKENAKFCPQCGAAVTYKNDKVVNNADVPESDEIYSVKKKKSKKFVWGIIVALVVVAIAVICALVIVQKIKL